MKIKYLSPAEITPYENNPRITEQAVQAVRRSIREFGFNQPITVDKNLVIITGHVRHQAAKLEGLEQIPVVVLADLAPEKVAAYRLADNKLGEIAEWDEDKLSQELIQLSLSDQDMEVLGFAAKEISKVLLSLQQADDLPEELDDEALNEEPPPPPDPFTQPGDVYEIGPHRLVCGDSTIVQTYHTLLGDDLVDLVFTDPPYNVAYKAKAGSIQNDDLNDEEFRLFLFSFFRLTHRVAKAGCPIYVCFSESEGINFRTLMTRAKWQLKQTLVWVKNQFVMGRSDYQNQYEPILYGWKAGASHAWYGDRKQSSVWRFDKPQRNADHPTMKPVALVAYALGNSSQEGDLVLDPFGGSGTTMVAAQQTGRRARLIELDPGYCDVIVNRMRKLWPSLPIRRNGQALEATT